MTEIQIQIDKNTNHHYFDDYITSIHTWCSANCNGEFNIEVLESPTYNIPLKVTVNFYDMTDAAYFKLSPLWTNEFLK